MFFGIAISLSPRPLGQSLSARSVKSLYPQQFRLGVIQNCPPTRLGTSALETQLSTPQHHSVFIIGSGPAGYTAGLYTARADLAPYMAEHTTRRSTHDDHGGKNSGFPEGVMGPDMMVLFEKRRPFRADR